MGVTTGSVYPFLAEHRAELFPEALFADPYPSPNGRPSVPPQVLARALALKSLAGSDLETVPRCAATCAGTGSSAASGR